MTRIGITGHSDLAADTVPVVADGIREAIAGHAGEQLVGVTCQGC